MNYITFAYHDVEFDVRKRRLQIREEKMENLTMSVSYINLQNYFIPAVLRWLYLKSALRLVHWKISKYQNSVGN